MQEDGFLKAIEQPIAEIDYKEKEHRKGALSCYGARRSDSGIKKLGVQQEQPRMHPCYLDS